VSPGHARALDQLKIGGHQRPMICHPAECERGEDSALKEYGDAMKKENSPRHSRDVSRQYSEVKTAPTH